MSGSDVLAPSDQLAMLLLVEIRNKALAGFRVKSEGKPWERKGKATRNGIAD